MKGFIPTWRFGMKLFLRLIIMLFCALAGPAILLVVQFALVSLGIQVSGPAVVLSQLLSVVVVGPLLLAGYADYCGFQSATPRPESSN